MGKIYARLLRWLLRPALPLPCQVFDLTGAALASRGDVLVLRAARVLSCEQYQAVVSAIGGAAKIAGLKIILLEPWMEVVRLSKPDDNGGDSDNGANNPLPLS